MNLKVHYTREIPPTYFSMFERGLEYHGTFTRGILPLPHFKVFVLWGVYPLSNINKIGGGVESHGYMYIEMFTLLSNIKQIRGLNLTDIWTVRFLPPPPSLNILNKKFQGC